MKKIILLCIGIVAFSACLNDDYDNFGYEFVKIDEAITPASFTFGEKDTIKLKYTLKNSCYSFDNIYYEYQDTARIVAVRALVNLDDACQEIAQEREYNLIVNVAQRENYLFKFYQGRDSIGQSIFEEVEVPVN